MNANGPFRVSFGLYEADLKSGELWRSGRQVKLQGQPFKVLGVLLENAGEVVSREELQHRVWGPDVVVDFEHSLGSAVKKVREALGDSAENPRFIETLSRRGYRFIAPVTRLDAGIDRHPLATIHPFPVSPVGDAVDEAGPVAVPGSSPLLRAWPLAAVGIASLLLGALLMLVTVRWLEPRQPEAVLQEITPVTQEGNVAIQEAPTEQRARALAIDGDRLFTAVRRDGRAVLAQIYIPTGESRVMPLPSSLLPPLISDISRDGTKLLVRSGAEGATERPLWVVPVDVGSAARVPGLLAQDATWMPDGKQILYASGNRLAIVSQDGGAATEFATLPGEAYWLRWSRDGERLRFTMMDPRDQHTSLWEIVGASRKARPLLPAWSAHHDACCGVWTPDGRFYVFQSTRDGHENLWRVEASGKSQPIRITNGPLGFGTPAPGMRGGRIFFVGQSDGSELQWFDGQTKTWEKRRDFLAGAKTVIFSRDGRWVAWTDEDGRLWKGKTDGSERVRLSPNSMQVARACWSPDGSRLAVMAREPGGAWQVFLVGSEGGGMERLLGETDSAGDPSFSPDGKRIVFVRYPDDDAERELRMLELDTGRETQIADSRGMSAPRWSPDGRYIAALTREHGVALFHVAAQRWTALANPEASAPLWSKDSRYLYVQADEQGTRPIYRLNATTGERQAVVSAKDFPAGSTALYSFAGMTPEQVPLVRVQTQAANVYTMDLNGP